MSYQNNPRTLSKHTITIVEEIERHQQELKELTESILVIATLKATKKSCFNCTHRNTFNNRCNRLSVRVANHNICIHHQKTKGQY